MILIKYVYKVDSNINIVLIPVTTTFIHFLLLFFLCWYLSMYIFFSRFFGVSSKYIIHFICNVLMLCLLFAFEQFSFVFVKYLFFNFFSTFFLSFHFDAFHKYMRYYYVISNNICVKVLRFHIIITVLFIL